jgi:oligopeptide transport system ATP-binding protein
LPNPTVASIDTPPALSALDLIQVYTVTGDRTATALEDFSLRAERGETISIVGGRGAGKTVAMRILFGRTAPTSGSLQFNGLTNLDWSSPASWRERLEMQLVDQEAERSLQPSASARDIIVEALRVRERHLPRAQLVASATSWLSRTGLHGSVIHRPSATLSGGEKQKLAFCRAISLQPKLLGLDSPFTKIDAAGRAELTNLLLDLQAERPLTVLVASHDFNWARFVSERFLVLYLGRVVESGSTPLLAYGAAHPYTRTLMGAQHTATEPRRRLRLVLDGVTPDLLEPPNGCHFHPRCPRSAKGQCDTNVPELRQTRVGQDHWVACFFPHL